MESKRLLKLFQSHFWILLHTSAVIGPLTAFSAILLGLVYVNIWDNRVDKPTDLTLSSGFLSDILYVDYSATSLILVASWSSSIALPLIGSLLSLTSYPVAAHMILASRNCMKTLLPTPSQLGLVVELLDGRKTALWTWLRGLWHRDEAKVQSLWMIELPVGLQFAGILLSAAIIAADTWLHVATSSTTMWYLANVDPVDYAIDHSYSRLVKHGCAVNSSMPCPVTTNITSNTITIQDSEVVKNLIMEDDPYTQVNKSASGQFFLAPKIPNRDRSLGRDNVAFQTYTAMTEAVSISCNQSLTGCQVDTAINGSQGWRYNCPKGMSGNITADSPIQISSWYQPPDTIGSYDALWTYYNNLSEYSRFSSIEFGLVAFLEGVYEKANTNGSLNNGDPSHAPSSIQVYNPLEGSIIAIQCNATFQSGTYDWTNMTAEPVINSTSTSNATNIARSLLFAGYFDGGSFDNPQRTALLNKLKLPTNNVTGPEIIDRVSGMLGLVSLSLLGGMVDPTAAVALKIGRSTIVTQVRKAPLFILVMLNLWYAAFAACLGILVIYILRNEFLRDDVLQVQQLLTINGLATSTIGRHEENLDDTNMRVCVQKIGGKWRFRVLDDLDTGEQAKSFMSPDT